MYYVRYMIGDVEYDIKRLPIVCRMSYLAYRISR